MSTGLPHSRPVNKSLLETMLIDGEIPDVLGTAVGALPPPFPVCNNPRVNCKSNSKRLDSEATTSVGGAWWAATSPLPRLENPSTNQKTEDKGQNASCGSPAPKRPRSGSSLSQPAVYELQTTECCEFVALRRSCRPEPWKGRPPHYNYSPDAP